MVPAAVNDRSHQTNNAAHTNGSVSATTTMPVGLFPSWLAWVFVALPFVYGVPAAIAFRTFNPAAAASAMSMSLIAATIVAAVVDFRWQRIPNSLTYGTLCSGLLLNLVAEIIAAAQARADSDTEILPLLGSVGLSSSFGGAAACFVIMLAIYCTAGGGAGDVKLAAAIGAGLGVERGLSMLIWTYAVAGALILTVAIMQIGPYTLIKALARKLAFTLFPHYVLPPSSDEQQLLLHPVPLGPAFAVGTIVAIFGGNLLDGRLS